MTGGDAFVYILPVDHRERRHRLIQYAFVLLNIRANLMPLIVNYTNKRSPHNLLKLKMICWCWNSL